MLSPHPYITGAYAVTYDGLNPFRGLPYLTVDQIWKSYNEIKTEEAPANKKRQK